MSNKSNAYIPGLIVFLALIILFAGILWLSGRNIAFSKDYRYYFDFDDVVGLSDMSPVYMRGYRIGWTKEVIFDNKDFVRVAVNIRKKFQIPIDSEVEITMLNFIGEKGITIYPGESKQFLQPGEMMKGTNKDLMTLASKILDTAKTKLEESDLDQLITKASESMDTVLAIFQDAKAEVSQLDMAKINQQIEQFGLASQELKDFLAAAQKDTRQFTQTSSESLEKFNHTLELVDEALEQVSLLSAEVKRIAEKINRAEGTAGELIQNKEFYANLNQTLVELNAFLADIKENPKKYVKFSIF